MNGPKRALVVDDDHTIGKLLQKLLGLDGWDATAVTSLAAARASGGPWDLVIADVQLPNGDGRELRADFAGVPFIVLSGAHDEQVDITKPFTYAQLRYAVDQIVGAR